MRLLMLLFIILAIYWVSGCTTAVERVNSDVNKYPYCKDEAHGLTDITEKGCGDCEDYALEKCKRLAAMGIKSKMLYRVGEPDHIALLVGDEVLDNPQLDKANKWPYHYDKSAWNSATNWNCGEW